MKKIKFDYLLLALIAMDASIKALDGLSSNDVSSITALFVFSVVIKMLSGIRDVEGIGAWAIRHKVFSWFLLFAYISISIQAAFRYFSGQLTISQALISITGTILFFAACLVVWVWLMEKISNIFFRRKNAQNDPSAPKD